MDGLHAPSVASGPTTQPSENGIASKKSLQELVAQKENIEAELSALSSVLDSHGVNMNTPLTTPDGFPRADIDVAQIRTTRARIIRLKNDHKAVMAKLEVAVQEQFAAAKDTASQSQTEATAAANAAALRAPSAPVLEPPFAKVNTVHPGSPADASGLRPEDRIVKFGTVNWTNHERLGKIAQVVQQSENRAIVVKVMREDAASSLVLDLRLTPQRGWGGRGLLGCHLVPL